MSAHGSVFDDSALAKLYHQEIGSDVVQRLLGVSDQVSFISRLGAVEMHSVPAAKVRTGGITANAMELARRGFRADIRTRRIRVVALRTWHYQRAEELLACMEHPD